MIKTMSAFTLFEILITLFIATLVSAMVVPSLHLFWQRAEDQILQDQLLRAINMAKTTAWSMQAPVSLCEAKNSSTLPICAEGQPDHLLVFIDEDATGKLENKDHILALKQLQMQHGALHWRSFPRYRQYWLMQPNGLLNNDNGTFWHCHGSALVWAIFISKSGRTRLVYPDQKGEIEDGSGKPLLCAA